MVNDHGGESHCWHAGNMVGEAPWIVCCWCDVFAVLHESQHRERIAESQLHAAVTGKGHGEYLPNEADRA